MMKLINHPKTVTFIMKHKLHAFVLSFTLHLNVKNAQIQRKIILKRPIWGNTNHGGPKLHFYGSDPQ